MEKKQIQQWFSLKTVLACVLGVLVVYLFSAEIAAVRLAGYEQITRVQIADQQTALVAIAEVTGRNGADAVTEAIVRDCTVAERSQFDDLLGRLNNGLSQTDLTTLERLFGRCGAFFSERKSLMAARLLRETEIYKNYVSQLSMLEGTDLSEAFSVAKWETLAKSEQHQSELFAQLVAVQDKIISTLLAGKAATSDEMQLVLQEAKEIQETLQVTNKQASTLRSELVPL